MPIFAWRHAESNLNGANDFLRIARGTLADSKTTIELYAGVPRAILHDFTDRERPADGNAGAIDPVLMRSGVTPERLAATTNSTARNTGIGPAE
jgi:hypothetical protein